MGPEKLHFSREVTQYVGVKSRIRPLGCFESWQWADEQWALVWQFK